MCKVERGGDQMEEDLSAWFEELVFYPGVFDAEV